MDGSAHDRFVDAHRSRLPVEDGAFTDEPNPIVRLEVELQELEAAAERCRKTVLVASWASRIGVVLVLLAVWRFDPTILMVGVSAFLGGLVMAGSTRATRQQLLARIEACEATRANLIDALSFANGPATGGRPRM